MIRLKGDPVLYQIAAAVPHGADVGDLVETMRRELRLSGGIGLAANQVGVPQRVILLAVGGLRAVVINPELTKLHGGAANSREGCLSLPGERVLKVRYRQVVLEGFDEHWAPLRLKLKGLTAFCAQHEVDHLNGRTIACAP